MGGLYGSVSRPSSTTMRKLLPVEQNPFHVFRSLFQQRNEKEKSLQFQIEFHFKHAQNTVVPFFSLLAHKSLNFCRLSVQLCHSLRLLSLSSLSLFSLSLFSLSLSLFSLSFFLSLSLSYSRTCVVKNVN